MNRHLLPRLSVLLALTAIVGCNQEAADHSWAPPALMDQDWQEPEGREVIQRHIDFMQNHQVLMTEALVSYEAVQEAGQKLHFDLLQRLAIQRPDKLHWVTLNDDGSTDSAWFSDGTFTMLKQPANVWGQIDVPHTIPEMVNRIVDEYDLDVPFRDLLAGDAAEIWLGDDITSVWWVGEAWVEGHWTDHVAVRKPGVDFELWVRKGDEPFLAKMAIVFTDEEGQPTYVARFRKWATAVTDGTTLFTFTPPQDAEQIEIVPVVER